MKKFILYSLFFILYSCTKENRDNIPIENKQDVPNYVNNFLFHKEFLKTSNLGDEERKVWEKEKGFKSFGSICDDFYATIDPEKFKTMDEIKQFVLENSEYLVLIPEANGEYILQTREFDNPYRYLVNKAKKMQVGNDSYNLTEKKLINEKTQEIFASFSTEQDQTNSFYSPISITPGLGIIHDEVADICPVFTNDSDKKDRDGDRTVFKMSTNSHNRGINGGGMCFTYCVQPFRRTLGVWFQCNRNITLNISFQGVFYGYNNEGPRRRIPILFTKNYTSSSPIRILNKTEDYDVCYETFSNGYKVICSSYSYKAHTPSSDGIEFSCH